MEGPLLEIRASERWATGVLCLPDGGLLTTGVDPFVERWSAQGALVAVLAGHDGDGRLHRSHVAARVTRLVTRQPLFLEARR